MNVCGIYIRTSYYMYVITMYILPRTGKKKVHEKYHYKKESHTDKYIIIHISLCYLCSIAYVKYVIIMMYHNNIFTKVLYVYTYVLLSYTSYDWSYIIISGCNKRMMLYLKFICCNSSTSTSTVISSSIWRKKKQQKIRDKKCPKCNISMLYE